MIDDVASQAGLVLFNVRLIEELRASRQRLVKAQDEERRRLERNIHDGAQQQLVALAVKANLAQTMAKRDPDKVEVMLGQLKDEATDALENLRDLARGIYPPLLADKGLAAALESQARKSSVPVALESDGLERYPQEVEAAVYFCCLEALQNISKYAEARTATIRLADGSGTLAFEVIDDGRGFDPGSTGYGTGLQGMADRLDALGRVAGGAKHAGAGNDRRGAGTPVVRRQTERDSRSETAARRMRETPHHAAVLDLRLRRRRSRIPGARDRASPAVSRRSGAESPFLPPR